MRLGQTTLELRLEELSLPREGFGGLTGRSARMQQLFVLLERVAATDVTVVLLGETGTGKDVAARADQDDAVKPASLRKLGKGAALTPAEIEICGSPRADLSFILVSLHPPEPSGGSLPIR